MVDVCYDSAMDKLKGDAANGVPGSSNSITVVELVAEIEFLLITNALLIGNIEFKQENNTWQQYRVSPLQQYPLQQWVWGN